MQKYWSLVFAVVLLPAFLLFVVAPFVPGWWLPLNIATYGGKVDFLFYFILIITGVTYVLTEAVMVYFMYKYAAGPGRASYPVDHSPEAHQFEKKLEIVWSIAPAVILLIIAVAQIQAWGEIKYQKNMPKPDGLTQQMEVTARQWEWRVRYPSAARMKSWEEDPRKALDFGTSIHEDDLMTVNEIHTWLGAPEPQRVLVHLRTQDVLHSFFLPNLRLKQDAVPGKVIPVWFAVTQSNTLPYVDPRTGQKRWAEDGYNPATGEIDEKKRDNIWELACAEYCGARHSLMRGKLYVHKDKADFMEWLKQAQADQYRTQPAAVQTAAK